MATIEVNTGQLQSTGQVLKVVVEDVEEIEVTKEHYLELTDDVGKVIAGFREWQHFCLINRP